MSDQDHDGISIRQMTPEDVRKKVELIDKLFGHVDQVGWFNRHGNGPFVADVCVRANVHPRSTWPNARIAFGQYGAEPKEMDFGGVLLTIPQTMQVIKMLKAAVKECVRANPKLAIDPVIDVDDLDPDDEVDPEATS